MTFALRRAAALALDLAPFLLFAGIVAVFSALSPRFATWQNAANVLIQSSSTAIVATGMTFVLLTAGIDLSVGAVMLFAGAVAGKLVLGGAPIAAAAAAMAGVGLACGAANGLLVSRLRMAPFIVTLATLFVWRGAGLWVTQTRAMNLPDEFREIATGRLFGVVPTPVAVLACVVAIAHFVLTRTPFGRQVYAVGHDPAAARKAGLAVDRILLTVYMISGGLGAVGGLVSLAQLAAVSPTFGRDRELEAIAAAVLGGVGLFGGRGQVFPGAVLGAVTIQTVSNGLNVINATEYVYPMITGGVIFLAVLLDGLRSRAKGRPRRPLVAPDVARSRPLGGSR